MARIGYDYCHEKKTSGYNLSGNIQMGHGQKNILGKKRSKAGRSERDDSNKCKGIGENVEIYIRIYIYILILEMILDVS